MKVDPLPLGEKTPGLLGQHSLQPAASLSSAPSRPGFPNGKDHGPLGPSHLGAPLLTLISYPTWLPTSVLPPLECHLKPVYPVLAMPVLLISAFGCLSLCRARDRKHETNMWLWPGTLAGVHACEVCCAVTPASMSLTSRHLAHSLTEAAW